MEGSVGPDGQVQSLLMRVVQCNRIQMTHTRNPCMKKCLQGRVYFMVFENLMHSRLQTGAKEFLQSLGWVHRRATHFDTLSAQLPCRLHCLHCPLVCITLPLAHYVGPTSRPVSHTHTWMVLSACLS